jgi:hypothetical protein
LIEVDGKVFMAPTAGLTTAGTSTFASLRSDRLIKTLSNLAADPDYLWSLIERHHRNLPEQPKFRIIFVRTDVWWGFAVKVEETEIL